MQQQIAHISLVVNDYDEAIDFYTQKLKFRVQEDTALSDSKRWVLLSPPGEGGACLLLAKAADEIQRRAVGNQSGGRVFLFLHTDDFWRDYHAMQREGVQFVRSPSTEPYGTVAVFKDLYGNLWDLVQPATRS